MDSSRGSTRASRFGQGPTRSTATAPGSARLFRIARLADERARGKPAEERTFWAKLDELRPGVVGGGEALVAQVEHRWRYPEAPHALYVFTSAIDASPGYSLLAGGRDVGVHAPVSTKYGRAKRTLIRRIGDYDRRGIGRARMPKGSIELRALVYGDGPFMPREPELSRIASVHGTLLPLINFLLERARAVTS